MLAVVESATYIHHPGVPRWQPITLVGVLTCTLVVSCVTIPADAELSEVVRGHCPRTIAAHGSGEESLHK